MITRAKAEEAADELRLFLEDGLHQKTVLKAYKEMAKITHPDGGGSPEAFARVDWAKHALLKWLEMQDQEKGRSVFDIERCEPCNGTGRKRVQRGFKSWQVMCSTCRGTGEAGYEADNGAEL